VRTVIREKFLFPVLATLIGCCLALLLLEIVLRVASLAPSRGLHSVNENTFEEIPGIWVPLQDFVWKELPALPYHVRVNSLGYRGSEIPLEKPADELRIFVAGDSYTFGSFVDNDETLPAQLESSLAGGYQQWCSRQYHSHTSEHDRAGTGPRTRFNCVGISQ